MDWNYPVNKFFELPNEKREEYVLELAKHYFKHSVSKKDSDSFEGSTNVLINRFQLEERKARKEEDYERAEIYYQLARIFIELQDNFEKEE